MDVDDDCILESASDGDGSCIAVDDEEWWEDGTSQVEREEESVVGIEFLDAAGGADSPLMLLTSRRG